MATPLAVARGQHHYSQPTSLQNWFVHNHVWSAATLRCPVAVKVSAALSDNAVTLAVGRRHLLAGFAAMTAGASQPEPNLQPILEPEAQPSSIPADLDYATQGPFRVARLPRIEHTCHKLFPQCLGTQCLLRLDIFCPKGGSSFGAAPPYPVAIFTGGFLVGSSAYVSYAERLASWGYVTVLYDKAETAVDNLDDVISVKFIQEIMDWCGSHPVISRVSDTSRVYLCGHSRGGKLSVLAAAVDPRVVALCLLDPVDNTVWAPLGPGYPSAIQALKQLGSKQTAEGRPGVPLALVGSGLGGDCAPKAANFRLLDDTWHVEMSVLMYKLPILRSYPQPWTASGLFYEACTAPSWMVSVEQAGHFQFLDKQSSMQRAVCAQGRLPDYSVRQLSQAVMVAWAQATIPAKTDASQQLSPSSIESATLLGRNEPASDVVSRALAAISDPYVQLQSQTKNI